jgi:hypothetical protein
MARQCRRAGPVTPPGGRCRRYLAAAVDSEHTRRAHRRHLVDALPPRVRTVGELRSAGPCPLPRRCHLVPQKGRYASTHPLGVTAHTAHNPHYVLACGRGPRPRHRPGGAALDVE